MIGTIEPTEGSRMQGLPDEALAQVAAYFQALSEPTRLQIPIFCAVPIFGSRLHEICVENGYIGDVNFVDFVTTKSVIHAPGVDPSEIERTVYQINLTVNFVHNYNLKAGNYETAAKYFENVVTKYPGHAFGHYGLARAYEGLGYVERAAESRRRFIGMIACDPWWREQAERYGLPVNGCPSADEAFAATECF